MSDGYQPHHGSQGHKYRSSFWLAITAYRPSDTNVSIVDAIWKMRGDATQYHPEQAERVIAGKALLHSS